MKWTTDMFGALAAVAWADGEMKASEASALVAAAGRAGLTGPELATVERMTRSVVRLDAVDLAGLDGLESEAAEYLYALACVVSAADGHMALSERACIAALAARLGLSEAARRRAEHAGLAVCQELGLAANALEALAAAIAEGGRA